jgi:hypothetical protein
MNQAGERPDNMKAVLNVVVVVTGLTLLAFVVHDMVSFGWGISGSVWHAPSRFWDAFADATRSDIDYKMGVIVALAASLAILFVNWVPSVRSK